MTPLPRLGPTSKLVENSHDGWPWRRGIGRFGMAAFYRKLNLSTVARDVFDHAAANAYNVAISKRVLLDRATADVGAIFTAEIDKFGTVC